MHRHQHGVPVTSGQTGGVGAVPTSAVEVESGDATKMLMARGAMALVDANPSAATVAMPTLSDHHGATLTATTLCAATTLGAAHKSATKRILFTSERL
jgi:hypothetical protein